MLKQFRFSSSFDLKINLNKILNEITWYAKLFVLLILLSKTFFTNFYFLYSVINYFLRIYKVLKFR